MRNMLTAIKIYLGSHRSPPQVVPVRQYFNTGRTVVCKYSTGTWRTFRASANPVDSLVEQINRLQFAGETIASLNNKCIVGKTR